MNFSLHYYWRKELNDERVNETLITLNIHDVSNFNVCVYFFTNVFQADPIFYFRLSHVLYESFYLPYRVSQNKLRTISKEKESVMDVGLRLREKYFSKDNGSTPMMRTQVRKQVELLINRQSRIHRHSIKDQKNEIVQPNT